MRENPRDSASGNMNQHRVRDVSWQQKPEMQIVKGLSGEVASTGGGDRQTMEQAPAFISQIGQREAKLRRPLDDQGATLQKGPLGHAAQAGPVAAHGKKRLTGVSQPALVGFRRQIGIQRHPAAGDNGHQEQRHQHFEQAESPCRGRWAEQNTLVGPAARC